MSFLRPKIGLALIMIASMVAPGVAQTQAKHHRKKPSAASKQAAKKQLESLPDLLPEQPAPPPPPPTLEQMPAVAPQVTYQYGLLTIVARNSVLGDVLRAVKAKTGANIDVPAGATERVVAQLGPGPARDVLAKLLNGTHFNYVMLGTAANPNAVAQVILTPSTGGPEPGPVAGQQPGMPQQGMVQPGMPQPGMPQPYPNGAYPNQPPPVQPGPAMQAQNPGDQGGDGDSMADQDNQDNNEVTPEDNNGNPEQANENQQNPNQPQVKTPEQLLQELQRQQQQQQQQQGQTQGQQQEPQSNQPQVMQPRPGQPQIVYPQPQQQQPPQQQPQ